MFTKRDTLCEGERLYFERLAEPARGEIVTALGEFLDSPDLPDPIIELLAAATGQTFGDDQLLSMRTAMASMRDSRIPEPKRLLAALVRYSGL